ncbi:hypothetical protein NDU88_001653 [Pleurodeles waltl]|uniref:Uncharacterized protein n=1 Tax=Pleurodeles waltl TaxID=8319 RepID=A0AAV7SZU4_PLEWA|nr:hypothetical protein NDU88_001653 [Pleurodeles waltl]
MRPTTLAKGSQAAPSSRSPRPGPAPVLTGQGSKMSPGPPPPRCGSGERHQGDTPPIRISPKPAPLAPGDRRAVAYRTTPLQPPIGPSSVVSNGQRSPATHRQVKLPLRGPSVVSQSRLQRL